MDLDERPVLCVPGFGLPVDELHPSNSRLPHAIQDSVKSQGITLRERRMLNFMGQITDKPEWTRKVFDEMIIAKWREEAVRWDSSLPEKGDWWLSEIMFETSIQELQEKAKLYAETGMVDVLDAEAVVVKSDHAVSADLVALLREHVRPLEDVPEKSKDWHPNSSQKVLDLVHPSLFPVVYGVSKALPTGLVPLQNCIAYSGKGDTIPQFSAKAFGRHANGWGSYQWIPSQVSFSDEGRAKITSYVNNLHPRRHEKLYPVLERFLDAAIPLWNSCISRSPWDVKGLRIKIECSGNDDYTIPKGVKFPRDRYKTQPRYNGWEPPEMTSEEEDELDDDEWATEWECEDEYHEWEEANRVLEFPEPNYVPKRPSDNSPRIDLRKDFKERGLQVIFKLANIHLTPEEPNYEGGSWHIEGSLNEHICATAVFYYDCDNVTNSHLAFRQSISTERMVMKPGQDEYSSICAYYGIEQDGHCIMDLGSVLTRQGRLIAFSNILQHQIQPFSLSDKALPGHRKVLAMFLIDPNVPILSTANVPPQSKNWWAEEVRKVSPLDSLPEELFEMIIDQVNGFPMSWEEAVSHREDLMSERGMINHEYDEQLYESTFNFCEH